mgnify:CR=1 FL=1
MLLPLLRLILVATVVVEVVVDGALSDPIVFSGILDYWLLEVGFEIKHLNELAVRVSYQI